MQDPRVKIALYGAGSMGSYHARVISENSKSDLAYVIDIDPTKASDLSRTYGSMHEKNSQKILPVDAVVIATPTDAHYEIAKRYLEVRIPVLVEKPISQFSDQVVSLIELARVNKVAFRCGLVERFNPVIVKAIEMVKSPIHFASIRHSPYVPRIQSHVTGDLLVHDLDICLQIFKREGLPRVIKSVSTTHLGRSKSSNQMINLILEFPQGHSASLSASRLDHQKKRKIQIIEEDRTLELDLLYRTIAIYRSVSNQTIEKGLSDQLQTIIEIPHLQYSHEPLAAQFQYFLDSVSEYNLEAENIELQSYLDVHELLSEIKEEG